MKLTILLLALATAAFAEAEKVRYDFHELHRLVPKTQEQLHALRQFQLAHKVSFLFLKKNVNFISKIKL